VAVISKCKGISKYATPSLDDSVEKSEGSGAEKLARGRHVNGGSKGVHLPNTCFARSRLTSCAG
jgi:hypothetical protein